MDFAIAIHTTRLQPELLYQTSNSLIGFVLLRVRLLAPGIITARMNVEHPAQPSNRPTVAFVPDKGVPQSDSFAKYAAVDSIDQCNKHGKTSVSGDLLDETNVYDTRKRVCI